MKVSLNIVKQYTSVDLPVEELVEKINQQLGGVEEVIDLGAKYKGIVIARVVSCVDHPDSDHLHVCMIDDGGIVMDVERDNAGLVRVVCGAANVREGLTVAWLPPRATVPSSIGTGDPFVLSSREIRGVMSNGMLASPAELAIGDNHDGILEINPSEWKPSGVEIAPGVDFAQAFGLSDVIIDIENKMFTHRPDCFGQLGVAREISAILKGVPAEDDNDADTRFVNPDWYWLKPAFESAEGLTLSVHNDVPQKVPRLMAVAMKDVSVEPSPLWLQCALVALGSKPINNIVDLTNYIMLLTAQPTHAYDYDKLRGGVLGARMAKAGETITLLNGKQYSLSEEDIVMTDGEGAIGLGGIMGGGNSEVFAGTKNIVLEVANFDMYTLRRSSMRHGLFTDALTRFSKGQSPLQNDRVIARLMELMVVQTNGKQASDVFDMPSHSDQAAEVSLSGEIVVSSSFINARLGLSLEAWQIGGLLRRANFASYPSEKDENTLIITAPFWRTDIEQPEDIVEEVGRLYGFDKLPRELPERPMKPAPQNAKIEMKRKITQILSSAGANEVKTYSFVHERVLKGAGQDVTQAFKLSNALSPDLQYYRLSLTPSILDKVHSNIKAGHNEFALFEFGKAHRKGDLDDEQLPREYERLALVYAAKKSPHAAYYTARRYVEALSGDLRYVTLADFDASSYPIFEQLAKSFDPKRAAVIMSGDQFVGVVGEYATATRCAFKLPEGAAGFELFQSFLRKLTPSPYVPLSRFPYVTQDVSLKVSDDVAYQDLCNTVQTAAHELETDELTLRFTPIGIYQPAEGATKTITLRLRATNHLRTLTDSEVTTILGQIVEAATAVHSAERV
ncbi:phenylalanine--tRNA ligase subunit beta [Candidatus Saccharibacteria bacterium]|nr:MAG: phenylalanine--tRNA ligase subunit beta [Candidatus Saccharibacteria bacterium]